MLADDILAAFPDARMSSGYARIRCPYHSDGKEKHPSMSVLLEARNGLEAGFCKCFACGKIVNISQLFIDIGLEPPAEPAISVATHEKTVHLTTNQKLCKMQLPFRKSDYLESRGISAQTQEKFRIYEKDKKVYMPVFDRQGRFLYANARSTVEKRFYVEVGAVKTLWGIEEIDLTRPIAVCESQIDSLTFWELNHQSVATLGADNVNVLTAIKNCTSTILLAFDPDSAGVRAMKRAAVLLGKFRCKVLVLPTDADVNKLFVDAGKDEFLKYAWSHLFSVDDAIKIYSQRGL